jgi:hypothetical protein
MSATPAVTVPTAQPSRAAAARSVERRRFPFPYRAALAVCSDLDETPDLELYANTLRFLNGRGATPFGDGLGLEIGNTIYFDMPPDQFSYWNTTDRGREVIRALIRSGHVDCLHSFGDLADTRAHAGRALDDLERHGCRLEVWIDHAVAPSNFGPDIMCGTGDVAGSPVYHADLTWAHGVRFVWRGRVTSVTGQGVAPRLGGIFTPAHPVASARTLAKEAAKGVLGRAGSHKYRAHATNDLIRAATLRSGQPVWEFVRSNPHWGGVSSCDTATGFGDVMGPGLIDRLIAREGACVLYTHLGKTPTPARPFTEAGLAAWRCLAQASRDGCILVTTTRRLLGSWVAGQTLTWSARTGDDGAITIEARRTPTAGTLLADRDLDGLCFYVEDAARARLVVDGREITGLQRNPPDHTGRASVSVPWTRLELPAL